MELTHMERLSDSDDRPARPNVFFDALSGILGQPARATLEHDETSYVYMWACGCEAHDGLRCSAVDWCPRHGRRP